MKNKVITIIAVPVILAILTAIAVIFAVRRNPAEESENRIAIHLNEVLTNEMSDTSDLYGLDRQMEKYMQQWNLSGVSLSIMRNDSLLYSKGYGSADFDIATGPGTIMRVASVSKLLTATGIMVLKERDSLDLDDTVFNEGDVLGEYADEIRDKRCFDITIRHLLKHAGGFTSRGGDPMFSTLILMERNNWSQAPDSETLIKSILKRKLGFAPGSSSYYSNFGYLLLSEIIEKVTGEDYETWMQENVFKPAGCFDIHLAYNFYSQKYPNETRYFVQDNEPEVECFDGSGAMVERCYGGNDIRALKGAGAWVCSTPELARFIASIDGKADIPDIISEQSVREMTYTTDSDSYALGWNDISKDGTWTRTGTLSGTSALIKNYPDGECWIMVSNTGTWRGPHFTKWTSTFFRRMREKYSAKLPERNLFYL